MSLDHFEYAKDNILVVWQPKLCIHSGICVQGLPMVFNPRRKPWIITDYADKLSIISQVAKCPSGALTIKEKEQV